MKIGVYIGGDNPVGGGYQYSLTLLRGLASQDLPFEFAIIKSAFLALPEISTRFEVLNLPHSRPWSSLFSSHPSQPSRLSTVRYNSHLYHFYRQNQVNLVIYPTTQVESFEARTPYITAIHDLQHRFHPEFPEVGTPHEYTFREYLFRNAALHAEAVLVDSEIGKEDLIGTYNVESDKVKVLPYVADSAFSEDIDP